MSTDKPQLKTYIDPELYIKFKQIAENENRSVSNYLKLLVMQEIEKHEPQLIKTQNKDQILLEAYRNATPAIREGVNKMLDIVEAQPEKLSNSRTG